MLILVILVALLAGATGTWAEGPASTARPEDGRASRTTDLDHPLAGPAVMPTDERSVRTVERIRTPAFDDGTLDTFVAAMATVGIAVVDLGTGGQVRAIDGPPSAMRLTLDQARAIALETWAGGGIPGADLDAAAPVAADMPPTSAVLAAWVATADTPGGRLARAVMAGQDVSEPGTLILPNVVLTLFVDDLTERAGNAAPELRPGGSPTPPVARVSMALRGPVHGPSRGASFAAGDDLCTRATTFIDEVLTAAFDALKVAPPRDGAGAVIVGLWNWLVDQGHAFVRVVVDELLGTIRPFLEVVVGTVATISVALSSLAPYAVTVTPLLDAGGTTDLTLPIAPEAPVTGRFLARVETGGVPDWPPVVRDCARRLSGIELPSLRPVGSDVRWRVTGPGAELLRLEEPDRTLDERAAAGQPFRSVVQPPEVADGEVATTMVRVHVDIIRPGARKEMRSVLDAFLGRLGEPLQATLRQVLGKEMDALVERVGELLDLRGDGWLTITYRTPPATPTPPPVAGMLVRQRFVNKVLREVMMEVDLVSCDGGETWAGTFRYTTGPSADAIDDTVPMTFDFGGKARTTSTVTVRLWAGHDRATYTLTVRRKRSDGGRTRSLSFHATGKADTGPYGYTHMAQDLRVQEAPADAC